MIPFQLQRPEFKFLKVKSFSKIPIEQNWQKNGYNFKDIEEWISKGGNYGVICGEGNLIVIDSDNEELKKAVEEKLPRSFRVKTGSNGTHDYFICKELKNKIVLTKDNIHYGEIQNTGTQVIGPGSIHPNGNKYEILNDVEIQGIKLPELLECIKPFLKEIEEKENRSLEFLGKNDNINSIPIMNIISGNFKRHKDGEYFGPNPWHGSETGMNFRINPTKNVAYCFRCNTGINVAQAIGLNENIIHNCSDYLNKEDFKSVLKIAEEKYGLKRVKRFEKAMKLVSDRRTMAEQFLEIQPLYYDKARNWWMWDFEIFRWFRLDETDILNMVNKSLDTETIKSVDKQEIMEALRQVSRNNKPKEPKRTWIQFKDIIYDLETDKTFKATNEYFITNPIPWSLGKNSDTPMMDKIFEEWVGKDNIKLLYQIMSYCLIPDYPIHRLFCFIGSGLNGKSKYLELITRFVGSYNVTSTELDVLLNSRFEVTRLHKKLVCTMGETNFNSLRNTSLLKRLTGNDMIGFEYKNKDPFDDYNYAKILISTNNLPSTTDKTLGFYRRWSIIDFPNTFDEKKDILKDIPDEEYKNLALKSITILKELFNEREFNNEGTIEERAKRFEDRANPLDKFFQEEIEEDINGHIFKYIFRQRLDDWCKEHGFRLITDSSLGTKMKEMGFETLQITADWINNDGIKPRLRAWSGIKLKNINNTQVTLYTHPTTRSYTRETELEIADSLGSLGLQRTSHTLTSHPVQLKNDNLSELKNDSLENNTTTELIDKLLDKVTCVSCENYFLSSQLNKFGLCNFCNSWINSKETVVKNND